ncbi:hypothetical protein ABZV78_04870 [Micromonospora sp. NPDC004540]|uniref:hypothetical protein n=1 Tax=Micromonospora sp. NPDC004540 TaxID=3154457 RepID=UPI0033A1E9C8
MTSANQVAQGAKDDAGDQKEGGQAGAQSGGAAHGVRDQSTNELEVVHDHVRLDATLASIVR